MRIFFLRCKVHSVRHTYLFSFYLSKIKCKRTEVSSEPTYFLSFMNNGKAFSSLDGMAYSYQCSNQFQFLPGHWQPKRYWTSWDLKNPICLKVILITPGIIWRDLKNPICLKVILITPGIIWSLKFKTKRMAELWNYWYQH